MADVMQFENLCAFLSDSNCALLVLKFFNQDVWQHITQGAGVTIEKCVGVARG